MQPSHQLLLCFHNCLILWIAFIREPGKKLHLHIISADTFNSRFVYLLLLIHEWKLSRLISLWNPLIGIGIGHSNARTAVMLHKSLTRWIHLSRLTHKKCGGKTITHKAEVTLFKLGPFLLYTFSSSDCRFMCAACNAFLCPSRRLVSLRAPVWTVSLFSAPIFMQIALRHNEQ